VVSANFSTTTRFPTLPFLMPIQYIYTYIYIYIYKCSASYIYKNHKKKKKKKKEKGRKKKKKISVSGRENTIKREKKKLDRKDLV
jgi:hypothetical protein